ncbi:Phosphonate metabolism protein [phnG] protein [Cylindrospermopsis raciborskii CS-505]|nr:Phosphonate metabolism protein [phnG] protein [Cylindrospermopsis raciborskii CS-505]
MFTIPERQSWMSTLARAELQQLEDLIESLVSNFHELPNYTFLRNAEIGLVMVQARAGATGEAFNLGDMTMTRCVVQLEDMVDGLPISGFGYIGGVPNVMRNWQLCVMLCCKPLYGMIRFKPL